MKLTSMLLITFMSFQLNACKGKKKTAETQKTTVKEVIDSAVSNTKNQQDAVSNTPTKTIDNQSNKPKTTKQSAKNTQQKEMVITYTTSSRGSRESIVINGTNAQFKNYFRGHSTSKSKTLNAKNVKELKAVLERIDYKRFSKILPPSTKHQYDGAPAATITVFNGKESITCPTFDAGNPPKELQALVAKLKSFKP